MPVTIAATDPIGPVIKLGYAIATIPNTSEAVASFSLEAGPFVSGELDNFDACEGMLDGNGGGFSGTGGTDALSRASSGRTAGITSIFPQAGHLPFFPA
jgi:hypothetical protein